MVQSLCLEVDVRRSKVNEIPATIRHDSTVLETNVEDSKAKIASDTDQAAYAEMKVSTSRTRILRPR